MGKSLVAFLRKSTDSSATSTTCSGGTEVIKSLIDQLAQGLQKWVGWKETGDECCLKGTEGIGKKCDCPGLGVGGAQCCNSGSGTTTCHQCGKCGTGAPGSSADNKCYLSAYSKTTALWTTIVNGTTGGGGSGSAGSADLVKAAQDVHLLARIFLGSVCLIWTGLSQLGFLTGGSGKGRWEKGTLSEVGKGLGSFMAAMGYDLDRLNGSGGDNKTGQFVQKLLSGQEPDDKKNQISWQEFASVKGKLGESVAEYYSSIYSGAQEALKNKKTESICKQYPLLVLHILASGYFRAGSAGANKVPVAPKAATGDTKKDTTPRKPRTIREILYWLSALPYSEKYKALVERMQAKYPRKETNPQETVDKIEIHGQDDGDKTDLKKDCVTHYLMAACGYCPLVLIGIQGTIERELKNTDSATPSSGGGSGGTQNKCPEHSKDRNKRCKLEDKDKTQAATAPAAAPAPAGSPGKPLQAGEVCYGGYHLEVKQFGPLHGMYANGLFGFQMDLSAAQCLDQLRIYVYHCFYQLYFLRKQCGAGVVDKTGKTVLGWKSCRYGSGVYWGSGHSPSNLWRCQAEGTGNGNEHSKKCGLQDGAGGQKHSPLMCFLCDGLGNIACPRTVGRGNIEDYPSIEDHMNMESTIHPTGHLKMPQGHCPVPMGWQAETSTGGTQQKENHFKDLNNGSHKQAELQPASGQNNKYPAHCTGNTLALLLEFYCDPEKCQSGTLVVLLRLLACITPTVPRTLGDLFGFYYYIVNMVHGGVAYVKGISKNEGVDVFTKALTAEAGNVIMGLGGKGSIKYALSSWGGTGYPCSHDPKKGSLKTLCGCGTSTCGPFISPLSGQQYGQLSPAMAGTYLSWLVYLIGEFKDGLEGLAKDYRNIVCKDEGCGTSQQGTGCDSSCTRGTHGDSCSTGSSGGVCQCSSVVSCTGVLPVLYRYGFGYGDVSKLHKTGGSKKCDAFLTTLTNVEEGQKFKDLTTSINQLIYTTRLPWIFVLTVAWLVAVLYLAFGAIWPLDWTHMRSHWLRGGAHQWQCMWYKVMTGRKGVELMEYFGRGLLVLIVMV